MFMCLGVLIGSLVGFLPGIGGPSTLAIMLPFVMTMKDPLLVIALLVGMDAVGNTASAFTSISDFRSRQLWFSGNDLGRPSHGQKRRSRASAQRVVRRFAPRRPLRRSRTFCVSAGAATSGAFLQLAGIFHSYVVGHQHGGNPERECAHQRHSGWDSRSIDRHCRIGCKVRYRTVLFQHLLFMGGH